jgi:hypothetical protein
MELRAKWIGRFIRPRCELFRSFEGFKFFPIGETAITEFLAVQKPDSQSP